jgi:hypothetical protein
MKKIIVAIFLILLSSPSWATVWYARDGGGTASQCDGKTNVVQAGSSGNHCAFNHPRWIFGWDYDHPQAGTLLAGDTASIDGDSDVNPGQQAVYMEGYDDSVNNTTPTCSSGVSEDCEFAPIPAGTGTGASNTSIIGTGTHKPMIYGHLEPFHLLNIADHTTIQNIEFTDDEACAAYDPTGSCGTGGGSHHIIDGISVAGDDITMTDIYVHGMGRYGISGGAFGSATFTRLWVVGNGIGGFIVGNGGNQAVTGTLTFNQPIVDWNGCVEAYPLTGGIDNPANYTNCFSQADSSNGYGDGLAFGATTSENAGSWTLIGPGSISFNTQDGFDLLHGNSSGTVQVDKMRFEGNAGQQLKLNAQNESVTNSLIVGDCGWWYGAAQSLAGGMPPDIGSNHGSCRAFGDTILFVTPASAVVNFFNNTIMTNGTVAFLQDGPADNSVSLNIKNNIIQGGYSWYYNTTVNPGSGDNRLAAYYYASGTDGNGTGTTGLVWTEDYNIVTNTKNTNGGCGGAHDQCGVSPGFISPIAVGTNGGALNSFYQGQSGITLFPLANNSLAKSAGVNGLTYWNNENDYYNVTRASPPSMGGLEQPSFAVNGYGCFFNSDCGSSTCTNNICAGAGGSCSSNGNSCYASTPTTCCSDFCFKSQCIADPNIRMGII